MFVSPFQVYCGTLVVLMVLSLGLVQDIALFKSVEYRAPDRKGPKKLPEDVGLDEHCYCQVLVPSTHPFELAVGPLEGCFQWFPA